MLIQKFVNSSCIVNRWIIYSFKVRGELLCSLLVCRQPGSATLASILLPNFLCQTFQNAVGFLASQCRMISLACTYSNKQYASRIADLYLSRQDDVLSCKVPEAGLPACSHKLCQKYFPLRDGHVHHS